MQGLSCAQSGGSTATTMCRNIDCVGRARSTKASALASLKGQKRSAQRSPGCTDALSKLCNCAQIELTALPLRQRGVLSLARIDSYSNSNNSSSSAPLGCVEMRLHRHGLRSRSHSNDVLQAEYCDLNRWQSQSMIISAVSDAPDGPFNQERKPVLGPWSHNAMLSKHPNGTLLSLSRWGRHAEDADCVVRRPVWSHRSRLSFP